jgi:hypothetical protein
VATVSDAALRPKQNWIINPWSDAAFIIVTPVVALIWGVWTALLYGPFTVGVIFVVFNVAHHFPTFVRIYGDKDLLRRFRWPLLLGPIVPFTFSMIIASFLILSGQLVENLLFLFIILVIWDPWHFLMQHYGFMRIYDRHNRAPRNLASWMDFSICAAWFAFLMVAALDWVPQLLYDLELKHGIPLLSLFGSGGYRLIQSLFGGAAVIATLAYVAYLVWCYRKGYFVSYAKLLLLLVTFGIMYLAYVPNAIMEWIHPQWTFALGFATLGMVHVTQYLAIVWRYNRSLTAREGRARPGWFSRWFARGGYSVAGVYVGICLLYGFLLTSPFRNLVLPHIRDSIGPAVPWIVAVLLSAVFTSTLLHYYYDGFIWKVRHQENRENLVQTEQVAAQPSEPGGSWWSSARNSTAWSTMAKQFLYFGPPILFCFVTYALATRQRAVPPIQQAEQAVQMRAQGLQQASREKAQQALAAIDQQLAIEQKMIDVRPRAWHYTYVADLLYVRSRTRRLVIEGTDGRTLGEEDRRDLREACAALENSLNFPPPYGFFAGREMSREDIQEALAQLRWELEPTLQLSGSRP